LREGASLAAAQSSYDLTSTPDRRSLMARWLTRFSLQAGAAHVFDGMSSERPGG
jgi:hypothetical protein